jgi:hypothetical protein
MDLKALLEANKTKLKSVQTVPARKHFDIAVEDRPYSPPETETKPIQTPTPPSPVI